MDKTSYDMGPIDIAWCPGCGNFSILNSLKQALAELDLGPDKVVMVSGIGQAAKLPQYMKANYFNGLHGRAVPAATGIKAANPGLTVIVTSGDGCNYGEGGNHLMHAIRRNPDITVIVHDNMVYGLTKGQASPTSPIGFKTPLQVDGVTAEPFNPIALVLAMGGGFAARAFSGDIDRTKEIMKQAISHKGFSLVDVLQPCVTFNKTNTFKWFKENTYYLEDAYKADDRGKALGRAMENGKMPLGVFFRYDAMRTFEDGLAAYAKDKTPLHVRQVELAAFNAEEFR